MNTPICNKLKELKGKKRTPFHMPGHKRKKCGQFGFLPEMDITEICGFDDLHHPEGMIRESMDLLKEIYHTKESWYLVNGSTVGILASISSLCRPGDKIIIGRNCHKSVYHAVRLLHLKVFYIFPERDEYDIMKDMGKRERDQIRHILKEHNDIRAVVITSPTYDGVVTDIAALKRILKPREIPLIVDEAHGAHMIFHDYFPKSAAECGADLVVQSTHKTLPSLTQTAVLHLCTDRIESSAVQDMLSVYETSSPSYLLMASAEYGIMFMKENEDKVQRYVDNLRDFRKKCGQLSVIRLIDVDNIKYFDYDRGRLVFSVKKAGFLGNELFSVLFNDYHIELEMANSSYVTAITSVMDEKKDFDRLFAALSEIDDCWSKAPRTGRNGKGVPYDVLPCPVKSMDIWKCEEQTKEAVRIQDAEGRIAGDFVMLYPPGIPLLAPGEIIIKEMVENIEYYIYNGYSVRGINDRKIIVLST